MESIDLAASWHLDKSDAEKLATLRPIDPFAVLGPHDTPQGRVIRAFLPAMLASLLCLFAISMVTPPPSAEKLAPFAS